LKLAITALVLMAFASVACVIQNWWDKMTAEDRMTGALKVIVAAVVTVSVLAIVLIMI
jgi:hypothetical protein